MDERLPKAQIARLRERYVVRLATTADELVRLASASPGTDVDAEIVHLIHRLRGSAASFGFPALSELATSVEDDWTGRGSHTALHSGARALATLIHHFSGRVAL
jgi:HPt (histidine-containing phosphotransfer) domain-containing protein